jgi:chlorophyllide a reductase subunit Y
MKSFFADVGQGHAAGIWEDVPRDRPEFRKRQLARNAAAAKAEEPV